MLQLTSSRLPGVPLLEVRYTGPEYARWRRSLKFALETKGIWKYCNGKCTMPMPEAGATSPIGSTANLQPSLLEERREWVKYDREVKLDLFLSLAEEVMLEVFEVGPPLPPSNMNAQEMLKTLDERFQVFKFEAYHHAFCHFLNLHIDQFPSIEDFNQEFLSTIEDLLDHGHPLSNTQACSAYFSKLRCTQNPWVAKKLEEWDAQKVEVDCVELVKESPPWSIIRPLATKSSQSLRVESIPEEYLEDSSASDSDLPSDQSDASTVSSISVHSNDETLDTKLSKELTPQRQESVITTSSREITIRASAEDIAELQQPQDFRKEIDNLPSSAIPERGSSKDRVPGTILSDDPDTPLPEWLVSKKSIARQPPPPPHNRPLPPLPAHAARPSEAQFTPPASASKNSSQTSLSTLKLETTHPTLRPQAPLELHPALRGTTSTTTTTTAPTSIPASQLLPAIDTTPLSFPFASTETLRLPSTSTPTQITSSPDPTLLRRPSTSSPNLAIPWPSTPDIPLRPLSSLAALPAHQAPNPYASMAPVQPSTRRESVISGLDLNSSSPEQGEEADREGAEDGDSDEEGEDEDPFLPLQGTSRDSSWTYLYESKGGYLIPYQHRRSTSFPSPTPTPPNPSQHRSSTSNSPKSATTPTFHDTIIPRSAPAGQHKKSSSGSANDFVARLSGDDGGLVGGGGMGHKKKKSWGGVGVNLARFSVGKGVREII